MKLNRTRLMSGPLSVKVTASTIVSSGELLDTHWRSEYVFMGVMSLVQRAPSQ